MRCLYCGKELALLKRLTGGEFCSDAHRQQYKEEYNELALNRLLQAKSQPKAEDTSPKQSAKTTPAGVKTPESKKPEVPALPQQAAPLAALRSEVAAPPVRYVEPVREIQTAPEDYATSEPEVSEPDRASEPEAPQPEEVAPAAPGFVVDLPVPVMAEVASMAVSEADLEHNFQPSIPSRSAEVCGTQLLAAGQVVFEPSTQLRDYATRRNERGQEFREFVRSAPGIEVEWPTAGKTDLQASEESMEILISPQPPQASPGLWQESEREFETLDAELGDLVRLMFSTTGIEDGEIKDDGEDAGLEGNRVGAGVVGSLNGLEEFREPAPPQHPAEPVPDLVTKPLPLTLHGLAAGRGRPVQTFSPAATSGFEVLTPRSSALPLRPVMTLGPAPATVEPARKPAEKREPERTTPKTSGNVRKLDARVVEPEKRAEPRPRAVTPPATEAKPDKIKPESRKPVPPVPSPPSVAPPEPPPVSREAGQKDPKPAMRAEPMRPARPPVPQTPLDLGLPSLDLKKPSGSPWARIPMSAKIGVAAAVLILIGLAVTATIAYFSTRGPRVVEAGPAIPVSGWVNDWDTGPQVQITVLRGTLNLSDYRAQFQAQIDAKAVGWVFRARDPKNFYASKLEVVKTGSIWTAVLARFAVINGQEEARAHVPLSFTVQENTVFKVRLEAVGDHFVTWIQDQQVDEFTDGRIKTGGVGLYSERGESAILKGDLSVIPLTIKK